MATWPTVTDDDGSGTTGTILDNAFFGTVRDYIGGAWTDVAFASGNFTASGTQTWTLTSPDQLTYAYVISGKTMTLSWWLNATSVGGTPSTELRIAIPGGVTVVTSTFNTHFYSDNGTEGVGLAAAISGVAYVSLYKSSTAANWTGSTNLTITRGQITFEIA